MSVSVLIPTFKRPDGLKRALASLAQQAVQPDEIVVVDNAPDGAARAACDQIAAQHELAPIVFVEAPEPGVSSARNAGFAAAKGRFVAQLDDDESASPGWLCALLAARETLSAGVVFGPVEPSVEAAGAVRSAFCARLYARRGAREDGLIEKPWGCGNSLIDRAEAALPALPFDPRANEMGGEDDILFARLQSAGVRFGWAANAVVTEHVDPARARIGAMLRRAFAFGQGPSQTCKARGDMPGLARWMAIGAGQALIFSALAAPARLTGAEHAAYCLDKAAQGAGKLVWGDFAAPRFYGRSDSFAAVAAKSTQDKVF